MPNIHAYPENNFAGYARDVQDSLTPTATQRTTLIVAGCYIVAIALLCLSVQNSIRLNRFPVADEGGATRMSGGIPWITLPAGYLGSSFIGAALITCGFDTNASKIASLALAAFFLFTLWWARRNWLTWLLILGMSGLIVLFWFVAGGVALRFFVLFIGVMSCMYVLWDVIDDTVARKVNGSDASSFAEICGCCPSQVWGVLWFIQACAFFACGIIIGLVAFKACHPQSAAQQAEDAKHFLPVPGSSGALSLLPPPAGLSYTLFCAVATASFLLYRW
ncbi:hypothetical protein BN946_scf185000.g70 [Trametes cinnabarina]|uniref:Uncharacterized protein n=1 Tax=Pycnoporus cinnabarinus TaxID=5643 RepID=A0A060S3D9_PYCCI|nr:hypothetical protein BN946_scf185000.g70 [Trametes cinnabarina]